MLRQLNLFFTMTFFFFQCGQGQNSNDLPDQLPENLRIRAHQGGGMLPQSENIYISADSSYLDYFYDQARNKIHFQVSEEELKKLYAVFIENQFGKIQTREEKVYDRGGTSLYLDYGKKTARVSNSGMSFVALKWQKAYQSCWEAVQQLVQSKLQSLKRDFILVFDPSIQDSGHLLSYQISDSDIQFYSEKSGIPSEQTLRLLPGQHSFNIHITEKTEPSYQRKNVAYTHSILQINENYKGLHCSLKDKKILLEYIPK